MDSLTQAALGAAVGESVLGKKIGHKAAILGAIGGTIPDLDVLLTPFLRTFKTSVFIEDIAILYFFAYLAHFSLPIF